MKKVLVLILVIATVLCTCCNEKIDPSSSAFAYAGVLIVGADGETEDVSVEWKENLVAKDYPEWISVTKTGTVGEQIFHLTISANESDSVRHGIVILNTKEPSKSAISASISVTQLKKQE